jgi:hypothetical protein
MGPPVVDRRDNDLQPEFACLVVAGSRGFSIGRRITKFSDQRAQPASGFSAGFEHPFTLAWLFVGLSCEYP